MTFFNFVPMIFSLSVFLSCSSVFLSSQTSVFLCPAFGVSSTSASEQNWEMNASSSGFALCCHTIQGRVAASSLELPWSLPHRQHTSHEAHYKHFHSAVSALGAAMSKSRTYWLTETRLPASRHTRAVADSKATLRRRNTHTGASCAVVANRVEKTATPASALGERKWNEVSQQEKGQPRQRTSLGSEQCALYSRKYWRPGLPLVANRSRGPTSSGSGNPCGRSLLARACHSGGRNPMSANEDVQRLHPGWE